MDVALAPGRKQILEDEAEEAINRLALDMEDEEPVIVPSWVTKADAYLEELRCSGRDHSMPAYLQGNPFVVAMYMKLVDANRQLQKELDALK